MGFKHMVAFHEGLLRSFPVALDVHEDTRGGISFLLRVCAGVLSHRCERALERRRVGIGVYEDVATPDPDLDRNQSLIGCIQTWKILRIRNPFGLTVKGIGPAVKGTADIRPSPLCIAQLTPAMAADIVKGREALRAGADDDVRLPTLVVTWQFSMD